MNIIQFVVLCTEKNAAIKLNQSLRSAQNKTYSIQQYSGTLLSETLASNNTSVQIWCKTNCNNKPKKTRINETILGGKVVRVYWF